MIGKFLCLYDKIELFYEIINKSKIKFFFIKPILVDADECTIHTANATCFE